MDAKELRLGNLIQLYRKAEDKEMSTHAVSGIENVPDIGWMVELEDGFYINADKGIEPILLTEEWPFKFNLEPVYAIKNSKEIRDDNINRLNNFQPMRPIEYTDEVLFWRMGPLNLHYGRFFMPEKAFYVKFNNEFLCFVKYVHQLQNLAFVLTGQELQRKE